MHTCRMGLPRRPARGGLPAAAAIISGVSLRFGGFVRLLVRLARGSPRSQPAHTSQMRSRRLKGKERRKERGSHRLVRTPFKMAGEVATTEMGPPARYEKREQRPESSSKLSALLAYLARLRRPMRRMHCGVASLHVL